MQKYSLCDFVSLQTFRGLISIINYTSQIPVYCTICCHLRVRQQNFKKVLSLHKLFFKTSNKNKLNQSFTESY